MIHINELVERHILEYESRLKHIDELLQHTREAADDGVKDTELAELEGDRDKLHDHIQQLRRADESQVRNMFEKTGPMGVWDAVAQRLEKMVERIEGTKGSE